MARGINFQTIEKSLSDSLSYEISFDFCQFLSKHKLKPMIHRSSNSTSTCALHVTWRHRSSSPPLN